MDKYLKNLKNKYPNEYVYSIPISDITDDFPVLGKIWSDYKEIIKKGTDMSGQTKFANELISQYKHLHDFKQEVMTYPDKKKYDDFEVYGTYKYKTYMPVRFDYNDTWHFINGKYRHHKNGSVYPYYLPIDKNIKLLNNINCEVNGNFYYQPGGFREWHTNRINNAGYRIYFISCLEDNKSYFNYIHPNTNKVVNMPDKNEYANIFEVKQEESSALWHSVYSDTHRFSLAFNIVNM